MAFISTILSYLVPILGAIMILVFIHELGHFLAARLFGMRVEKFSVGFPPRLFGVKIGDTDYSVGLTPLGGYVSISGMVDERMDDSFAEKPPEPWEYRAKPVWQRMIVIVAGVVFNMILAWVIYSGIKGVYGDTVIPADQVSGIYVEEGSLFYTMGMRTGDRVLAVNGAPLQTYDDLLSEEAIVEGNYVVKVDRGGRTLTLEGPQDMMTQLNRTQGDLGYSLVPAWVSDVVSGSPAEAAGILTGDQIQTINGTSMPFWEGLLTAVGSSEGDTLMLGVRRAGVDSLIQLPVVPNQASAEGRYTIGVYPPTEAMLREAYRVETRSYSFAGALGAGWEQTMSTSSVIVKSFGRMFTGKEDVRENLGGPIMIAKITKQAAEAGALFFWNIVATLSITLAIINILPIPALDGGHLVFLIIEAVTRREPSLRVRMWAQQIGFFLMLGLMAFLIINDLLKL
jgi:regulator of sigma E protease